MIGKVAQGIVGANKAVQAGKTVKGGVQRIARNVRGPKQPIKPAQKGFKNVRTPSNTPGGMKGWQAKGQPQNPNPGKAVTIRKTKAHPEGVRRLVNAPKRPKAPRK